LRTLAFPYFFSSPGTIGIYSLPQVTSFGGLTAWSMYWSPFPSGLFFLLTLGPFASVDLHLRLPDVRVLSIVLRAVSDPVTFSGSAFKILYFLPLFIF